jgi:hypothetical protein
MQPYSQSIEPCQTFWRDSTYKRLLLFCDFDTAAGKSGLRTRYRLFQLFHISSLKNKIQGAYILSEYFAKAYFHKYWTLCYYHLKDECLQFHSDLNAFDVCPTCNTADVQAILPFPPKPLKPVLCDGPDCGVDALSQFWLCLWKWWDVNIDLYQMLRSLRVTDTNVTKSSDNLYAPGLLLRFCRGKWSVCRWNVANDCVCFSFGGLVVSMLASGTQVRGFKPGRSRRIFRAKTSSACLPSEGK